MIEKMKVWAVVIYPIPRPKKWQFLKRKLMMGMFHYIMGLEGVMCGMIEADSKDEYKVCFKTENDAKRAMNRMKECGIRTKEEVIEREVEDIITKMRKENKDEQTDLLAKEGKG